MDQISQISRQLIEAGKYMHTRGWVPATSGNFSARQPDGKIAITVSGRHKGKLSPGDIMLVDADGNALTDQKPSAETMLHIQIYNFFPEMQCVLHPHSLYATIISRQVKEQVVVQDYELLKAFPGIDTHECSVIVPVLQNDQDIFRLAKKVEFLLTTRKPVFGYLIAGHGFYTWAKSVEGCIKQVEAFEFLFQCEVLSGIANR
ncbi:MAG: methylthioribulose 1-phosphate dehydratase [Spirochaetia bacterium]|nr:methylthioribulose 1-phosphate dehydratase [Spirochaetia bacterium]